MSQAVTAMVGVCLCMAVGAVSAMAALPDGRGFELVSPPDKNGADVMAETSITRSARDGNGVTFASVSAFGDVQGTATYVQYLSERGGATGTPGWATHPIMPRQEALTVQAALQGGIPGFESAFTGDLSAGVYRSWRPLTDAPNVSEVKNLYRRGGLRSGAAPTTTLLTDAVAPVPPLLALGPIFAEATPDLGHVIFHSFASLTTDSPSGLKLYESTNGGVRLVSILPDGTPANGFAGPEPFLNNVYVSHAVADDGQRIFFTDASTRNVYVRIDGASTEQVNQSEKTAPEAPQGAQYWTASTDGTRAFFTTSEGLVDGDDDGGAVDVYMNDANAPAGRRLTLVSLDREAGDGHYCYDVVGASDDGHYAYFVCTGQLVSGEPLQSDFDPALYLWHDGEVTYVGTFSSFDDSSLNGFSTSPASPQAARAARVTPDGRHLLFTSRGDAGFRGRWGFAGYDHGNCTYDGGGPCRELYLFDADRSRLVCASCGSTGRPATAPAVIHVREGAAGAPPTTYLSNAVSADGRWVFFSTAEALVSADVNRKSDAYEYDAASGDVHLISSGKSPSNSYFAAANESGSDVFFVTRERLVGWDRDDNNDLYDARVNGGFPEPPAPVPSCTGEACQGPSGQLPPPDVAGSSAFTGAGDARASLRHRRRARSRCAHRGRVAKHKKARSRCARKPVRHGTRNSRRTK